MLKKILLSALTVIVLLCVGGGLYLYNLINQDVVERFAGTCEDVALPGSGEDIQIDRDHGYAYLSVLDRLGVAQGNEVDPGMVMRLDLNQRPWSAVPALSGGPDLRPHGLSLFVNDDGRRTLFVINHPADRANGAEAIERFVETGPGTGAFEHAQSYASPLITRANDMVAVSPQQFYVAQDVDRTSGETLTDLVYYDGSEYRVVADNIESGGGINVSQDLTTLYISETGGKNIRVATLDADGSIAAQRDIPLPTSPDNIDVAADGSLWVGGHSNVVALAMHFIAGVNAPSQILRVEPTDPADIQEIYMNAGSQISAGSGGATVGNTLVIGSITARKVLVCEMTG